MKNKKADITVEERYNRMIVKAFEGKDEISEVIFRQYIGAFHKAIVEMAVKNRIVMAVRDMNTKEDLLMLLPTGLKIQREM